MILVDPANWPWRDRRWAHLVSDCSHHELHDFAQALGLRRLTFQGDHYDIDTETRLAALDAGAVAVPARELAARLRGAGLRRRGPSSAWKWERVGAWALADLRELPPKWRSGPGDVLTTLVARSVADDMFERLWGLVDVHEPRRGSPVEVVVLERAAEVAVALFEVGVSGPPLGDIVADREPSINGARA